jgi:hypothetical protein
VPQEDQKLDMPVLFLIFNRPDLTEKVFGQIRKVKPKQLFIAADGPRESHPDDLEKCKKTRELVLGMIDWDCEVKTLFRDTNLGCGLAVSQAITWFFEHVEMGIILEDDCFPSIAFFFFCTELLKHFKESESIMHISGGSYLPDKFFGHNSYYFSKYPFIWGWATWREAWHKYDFKIVNKNLDTVLEIHDSIEEKEYWETIRRKISEGKIDTWDFRWNFSIWKENGISVVSTLNLIKNIGFNEDSTHIKRINPYYQKQKFYNSEIFGPIIHPKRIMPDQRADILVFNRYNLFLNKKSLLNRFVNTIYGRF